MPSRTRLCGGAKGWCFIPLIQLIVILIVIGLILYLVETLLPIDPAIKQVIRVVIVIAVILWLLSLVGLIPHRISWLMVPRRMVTEGEDALGYAAEVGDEWERRVANDQLGNVR